MGRGSPSFQLPDPLSCHSFSLFPFPIPLQSYSLSSIRGIALNTAVAGLLAKGAVEPAPSTPDYYSRLFVTPKVTEPPVC